MMGMDRGAYEQSVPELLTAGEQMKLAQLDSNEGNAGGSEDRRDALGKLMSMPPAMPNVRS